MRKSMFAKILLTVIAGIGNVKNGNWSGTIIYFSAMAIFGAALIFVERKYIEPIYQLPQSGLKFALLVFIAFIFFWDGNQLLRNEEKKETFNQDEGNAAEKIRK
jgi:hypothetical protein